MELDVADIYQQHRPWMVRLAATILNSDDDAEDCVQDLFVDMERRLASFRGDAAVSTWLHTCVRNAALMALRRQKRASTVQFPDSDAEDDAYHVRRALIAQPEQAHLPEVMSLRAAMKALSDTDRLIISLSCAGLRCEEIALRTGTTRAAVKARLCRSRRKLRARLANTHHVGPFRPAIAGTTKENKWHA